MTGGSKNLLALTLALLLGLLAAEGLFRLYERVFLTASFQPKGEVVDLAALNYNESSLPKKKPAGEFRVLSFGDSFCFGIVKPPYTYNGVAAEILTASGAGAPVRLVNLGEPSSSVNQYLKSYFNWAGQIEHDAVIFNIFLGNDLTDIAYEMVPEDADINRVFVENFVDVQTGRKRLNYVPRKFWLRMFDYLYSYLEMFREGHFVLRDIPEPYNFALGPMDDDLYYRTALLHAHVLDPDRREALAPGYAAVARLARVASDIMRRQGKKVLVVVSPAEIQVVPELRAELAAGRGLDPSRLDLELADRRVAAVIREVDPDLPVLDLLEPFRQAHDKGQKLYYPRDIHWTVEGNRLAGEVLAERLGRDWFGQGRAPAGKTDGPAAP